MRGPSKTWWGYNLVRVVAIAFTCWAVAAQFLAIVDDLKAYKSVSGQASIDDTAKSTTWGAEPTLLHADATISSSKSTSMSSSSSMGSPTSIPDNPSTFADEDTDTALVTATAIADPLTNYVKPSMGLAKVDMGDDGPIIEGQDRYTGYQIHKRGTDAGGYFGSSGVPRQAGGVAFAIFARLIIACLLGVLLCAQAGWPETFLYNRLGWFGAASTPFWLGVAQTILAVQMLSIYAKAPLLLPAWGVLVLGLLNIFIGLILLFLGRKMPKHPPPAMYFNHASRLLLWTSPPPLYRLITHPSPPSQPQGPKGILPPNNAQGLGLEDYSEKELDEEKRVEAPRRAMHTRGDIRADQDVQRGGYPTFSGGAMADGGSQVPTGVIDRDARGRIRGLIPDREGVMIQEVEKPGKRLGKEIKEGLNLQLAKERERPNQRVKGHIRQASADDRLQRATPAEARAKIMSNRPMSAVIPAPRSAKLSNSDQLGRTDPAAGQSPPRPTPFPLRQTPSPPALIQVKQKSRKQPTLMTPIHEQPEPVTAKTLRKNSLEAALEMEPEFPLPPERDEEIGVVQNARMGKRESLVKSNTKEVKPRTPREERSKPSKIVTAGSSDSSPPVMNPKTPRTPKSARTKRPEHADSDISSSTELLPTDKSSRRSSLVTSETKREKKPREVRFDLDSPLLSPDPTSKSEDPPATSGLRIPGTNITLSNPFAATPAPASPVSDTGSIRSTESRVSSPVQEERREKKGRRRSVAGYAGGKERRKERRRNSSIG